MKTKLILASMLTVATLAAPALANDHDWKEKFTAADTNKDGVLNAAEWKAAGWSEDKWAKVDANADGRVTMAEKEAYKEAKHDDKH